MPISRGMQRLLPSLFAALALCVACASSPPTPEPRSAASVSRPPAQQAARATAGNAVVAAAQRVLGTPYRYGGASPRGFDCSGLVVYSYGQAGHPGLPHSASELAEIARPVSLRDLAPGDLLFFELAAKKPSHVGIYAGNRRFIHAPSSGGKVEVVDFDHVYWSKHIGRAGRLLTGSATLAHAN